MPCSCCCGECDSPCCGTSNPVSTGECCGGVWRTGSGTCCADVWQTGSGVCCGGVWQTGAGECCGEVWRTDAGECCEGAWYPDSAPCPEGETYTTWGPDNVCCGCIPDEEEPPAWCLGPGEPKACCSEDEDGLSVCEEIGENLCVAPSSLAVDNDCATGCLGACCVDGVATQTTQEDCTGCWAGLGTTECLDGCRDPFTSQCCESVISSGALVTFTQPRLRRCPPFAGTFRVTVSGYTDSPVLVHGTPFGKVGKRCPINHSFLLCWDKFNIEPSQCDTDMIELNVTVCWEEEETTEETLNFSGCDVATVWLGACDYGCATTLNYSGAGHNSSAAIEFRGDGSISANGSGALVLSGSITFPGTCVDTLTLTGTSTEDNEISSAIPNAPSALSVVKTGPGLWRLSGANAFTGRLKVEQGTLVVAAAVGISGASPIGNVSGASNMPLIGTSTSGANFFLDNVTMSRGAWTVAAGSGTVAIGGIGTGAAIFPTSYTTRLGRDVTLQAGSGGTARFGNTWQDGSGGSNPAVAFTIGSPGNDGTVVLESDLPNSITSLTLVTGTLKTDFNDRIAPTTPVTIQLATYDRDGFDQSIDSLTVTGIATFAGSGTTIINNSLTGSGSIVNSAGTLQIDGTNTMTGSVSITGGSVVVTTVVSGPSGMNTATFTDTTLTVDFSSAPSSGQQFKLLNGSTAQSYTPTLTGAGGASATYNSSTSTLTIT